MNTKDKQFSELVMLITEGARPATEDADAILNAGYRKADEVAMEVFEYLEEKGLLNIEVWAIQDVKDELKKKYTEGEG